MKNISKSSTDPIYQYLEDGYLLQFNGEKSMALSQVKNDSLLKNNLLLEILN